MTPDPATPAERAAAVLRAAEAVSAAGRAPEAVTADPRPAADGAGAEDRLLHAADELAAGVDDARDELAALRDALARMAR